jgi:hypothetical protein
MTQLPKEHKVAPRWKRSDYGYYILKGADVAIATISDMQHTWQIKVRNRSGLWNYGYAASLPAAKRKAKRMIEEEGK